MKYLSFKDFVAKCGLKNETTSNAKVQEILNKIFQLGSTYYDKNTTTAGGYQSLGLIPFGLIFSSSHLA